MVDGVDGDADDPRERHIVIRIGDRVGELVGRRCRAIVLITDLPVAKRRDRSTGRLGDNRDARGSHGPARGCVVGDDIDCPIVASLHGQSVIVCHRTLLDTDRYGRSVRNRTLGVSESVGEAIAGR